MATDDSTNRVEISGGNVPGFIQENHGTVTQNFITQVSALVGEQTSLAGKGLTREEHRQRKVLLSKVKDYWIKGVLEKSLYTEAMIELGLEERSDAVESPFTGFEELEEEPRHSLLQETNATEFFDQIGDGRTLLILGEPGSGKTITLLKLAQNLITRAEQDVSQMIPVVFNLSSWRITGRAKRQTIATWLIEELWSKYGVPKPVGKDWIKNQQLILLLDALDEVQVESRKACVQAINRFMEDNGQTEVVVCSRIIEYDALSVHLRLRGAIVIRELTFEQINHHLDKVGEPLQSLKTLILEDLILQEFAKSPLMLSVMALAYQGAKVEEIPQPASMEERRQRLFDAYIKRMFSQEKLGKPREYTSPYKNQQTKLWLTWLAKQMTHESQNVFLIEGIQPALLRNRHQIINYTLILCLINGLAFYLVGEVFSSKFLFGFLVTSILALNELNTLKWNWNQLKSGLTSGLIFALVGGFIYGFSTWFFDYRGSLSLESTLETGGTFGLIGGGLVGLFVGQIGTLTEVTLTRSLNWSWKNVPKWLIGGLIFGLILGLIIGSSFSFDVGNELIAGLKVEIFAGLIGGVFFGLMGGVLGGWTGIEVEKSSAPNQGIWNSGKNFLIVFIGFLATVGGLGILLTNLVYKLANEYILAPIHDSYFDIFILSLILGLLFALTRGGEACIQHLVLRWMLHQQKKMPWNYAHFLDYAAERGFLRKVGGSYIFIHRMLQEHFARMYPL